VNLPIDREFVIQSLIAIGACLGGWMFLVQPKAEAVQALEVEIAKLRARPSGLSHQAVEQVAQLAPKLRVRARDIEARGAWAEDTSMLYGRVMSLAKEHDVQVRNLRPGEQKSNRDKTLVVTRVDMTAEAEYERIAEFLGALDGIGAYLRPISMQIAPTKRVDGSYAVMQLGFEALQFRLPKVVAEMKRLGDEHP
jgi:hypothetical protein